MNFTNASNHSTGPESYIGSQIPGQQEPPTDGHRANPATSSSSSPPPGHERLQDFLLNLENVSAGNEGQYMARCPAHEDNRASLSVKLTDDCDRILIHCFAGCEPAAVLQAMGLTWADINPPRQRIVATYPYVDEQGALLYEAVRLEPKDFRQRHREEVGCHPKVKKHDGWCWTIKGCRRVLYKLPQVLKAIASGDVVFVVEGEKDVHTLEGLGFVATTNAMGAGKWQPEYTTSLEGATSVVVCRDADTPGRVHSEQVAQSLHGAGIPVRVLEFPGSGKDVSDWVAAGGSREALEKLCAGLTAWSPMEEEPFRANPASRTSGNDGGGETTQARTSRANGAFRAVEDQERWPEALRPEAFHGLAGKIVRTLEPHTESDPAGMLFQFLTLFGNVVGRGPHALVNGAEHPGNLFLALIGKSSKARKGTSLRFLKTLIKRIEPGVWKQESGLSSGEGLIWAVRDPIIKTKTDPKTGEPYDEVIDEGVEDKRLPVIEEEFASVLAQIEREGNTLSPVIRSAWDSGDLSILTKNSRAVATGAHISVITHCTQEELLRKLGRTEMANGFGNRFLWVCVKRSKLLPDGGQPTAAEMDALVKDLEVVLDFAKNVTILTRDGGASELWHAVYEKLSADRRGLFGVLLNRAEAQVLRLSCLYALLDRSLVIRVEHLEAALAAWGYVEDSAECIFGDSLGDPEADEILRTLRTQPAGMSREDIRNLFQRHKSSEQISRALAVLLNHGLARFQTTPTRGRPEERWFAVAAPNGARKARYAREAAAGAPRDEKGTAPAREARKDEAGDEHCHVDADGEEVFDL